MNACPKCGSAMDEFDTMDVCAPCNVHRVFNPSRSDPHGPQTPAQAYRQGPVLVSKITADTVIIADEIKGNFNMDDM